MTATIRDLREFRAPDLEGLLAAQEREWREVLDWDFASSSDLVRKFVNAGDLNGAVLVNGTGVAIGYVYFVFEDGKGLLGDLYVLPEFRSRQHESDLMNSAMNQIADIGGVPRVEGQIMMLSAPLEKPGERWRTFEVFPRTFLLMHFPASTPVEERKFDGQAGGQLSLEPWNASHQEQAAHLIPATYLGHVDSRINDQYRNVPGARKFLYNIVQYPGCGVFCETASFSVFDRRDGRMCGMVLSSMVSERTGHITQVCVSPEYQGNGLGRELLGKALAALERNRCRNVGLTVTTENRGARMLYERLGFRTIKKFAAYVWGP